MEKTMLRRADVARGRFRSFLLGALVRYLAHEHAHRTTLKRGGALPPVTLEALADSPAEPTTPPPEVQAYDRDWAVHLMRHALATVETEWTQRDRAADFEVLRAYLPGSPSTPPYEDSASRLGIPLAAFKTEVHRLRDQLRKILRREIAATVASPEDIDDEVAYLGRVLQSAPV
jgi:RNA polymerase sigma-70 factor (ECF subfamily)